MKVEKKYLRFLHVASFSGNIGDNASHIGLTNIIREFIPNYQEHRLEIRRFYKNYTFSDKLAFDDDFVEYANSFDLLLIGGGGFLDYWVPNSETGTTIDISHNRLEKLTVPTLICSVGSIPHKDIPKGNEEKFKSFLVHLLSKKSVKILLRNDGSKEVLAKEFGNGFREIPTILDNGFFYEHNDTQGFLITPRKYVALNTTSDQLKMKNNSRVPLSESFFVKEIRNYIEKIVKDTELDIVMVPHIYADLNAFQEVLKLLPDFYLRTRIHVAPYSHGDYACDMLMSVYKNSCHNVGMRFHSNVCSLAMGKPISGLAVLDRVRYMHEYVGGDCFVIDTSSKFSEVLFGQTLKHSGTSLPDSVKATIANRKEQTLENYETALNTILF